MLSAWLHHAQLHALLVCVLEGCFCLASGPEWPWVNLEGVGAFLPVRGGGVGPIVSVECVHAGLVVGLC